jgi:hypothetical protein
MRTHLPLLSVAFLIAFTAILQGAEKDVVTPFNGRTLDGWKFKNEKESEWTVGRSALDEKDPKKLAVTPLNPAADGGPAAAELINNKTTKRGTDLYTEQKFGDCLIELEFMVSKGSNSGVYVMGEYEIQILDSFGKAKVGAGDLGGLYNAAPPKVNASKKPGEWQGRPRPGRVPQHPPHAEVTPRGCRPRCGVTPRAADPDSPTPPRRRPRTRRDVRPNGCRRHRPSRGSRGGRRGPQSQTRRSAAGRSRGTAPRR